MLRFLAPLIAPLLALGPAADPEPPPEVKADVAPDVTMETTRPAVDGGAEGDAAEPKTDIPLERAEATETVDMVAVSVLPSGVRVITARDDTLPVASVVLSIEVGTRDDPDALPGLVHALAYHLQQGNRELAPGEAIAIVHDAGGLASMAVGVGQTRFEALLPVAELDAVLRSESLRLRAPATSRELWLKSLGYARNDDAARPLVPAAVMAEAWSDPALAHEGRKVGKPLGDMVEQSVGAQLTRLFDYRAATLVVVGPEPPEDLLARVEPLFADLPDRARKTPPATGLPKVSAAGPRVVAMERQRGDSLVWPVPGEPEARAWAQVLCGTINRQQRADDDPPKARVRCTFADDARRPLLVLRALGYDPAGGPIALIDSRLDRIAAQAEFSSDLDAPNDTDEPQLAALIESQRERMEGDLRYAVRTPLELATYLASATEFEVDSDDPLVPIHEVLGLPVVDGDNAAIQLVEAVPTLLDTRAAIYLVDPEQADQMVVPTTVPADAGPTQPEPAEPEPSDGDPDNEPDTKPDNKADTKPDTDGGDA